MGSRRKQKTEKSISHSSSHGGRVFEFPLPAAAYIPISGSVSDGAASPAIGSISRKTAANLLPRAHDCGADGWLAAGHRHQPVPRLLRDAYQPLAGTESA